MTDYSKMSDFEINKAVAEELYKDKPSLIVRRDVPSRPAITVCCDIGDGEIVSILCADYCNNPADAWPIIEQNYISLTFDGISWDASSPLKEITYNAWKTHPFQPLRLAMIVFLMMKDAEKC